MKRFCPYLSFALVIILTSLNGPNLQAQLNSGIGQAHLSKPSSNISIFLRSASKAEKGARKTYKWWIRKADSVTPDQAAGQGGAQGLGAEYSQPGRLAKKDKGWQPAIVPGTVLTSLVANKVYPDPYFGDNNRISKGLIPDIANTGREFYHYWYKTTFKVPEVFDGKKVWLKFHGINYRAQIWLNGKRLGKITGMFNAKAFDVTDIVDLHGENALAVDIDPVDYPGSNLPPKKPVPGAKGEGHNGGDGEIGKNTTMLMSVGWDFTFPDGVRDRNTGIWQDVELYATGPVQIKNPYVQSKLPLPDTTTAKETISALLENSTNKEQKGVLAAEVKDLGIHIKKSVTLLPHEKRQIILDPSDYPALNVQHPKLWWPINKGAQHLYSLNLSFVSAHATGKTTTKKKVINKVISKDIDLNKTALSHQVTTQFGIRNISTDRNTPDSSRRFIVNGVPVFIRGANWIPEAMCKQTEDRTYHELRYIHQAGFNLLRLWGGGIAESDQFYHLCDSLGIMVWSEFWITGNTRFPKDTSVYMHNLRSTIKRIRSHASVAYYVSANESTELPGAGRVIYSLDSATNYQRQSECCGVHDGSPYTYVNPMQYFDNTASKRGSRVDGFNPEYGAPCLPILSSLKEMMPAKDLWPINKKVWDYMDGGGFHKMTTDYDAAVKAFGQSDNLADYVKKAQLVGAMNYRSIMDVWDYNKFGFGDRFASGFLFWYINSPEPQVASRLYDWSLEPTAALYYTKNGLEPLHVQFDYLKNTVSVSNDYRKAFKGYEVICDVYDLNTKKISHQKRKVDIPADGVVNNLFKVDFPKDITPVHFIKLNLLDNTGKIVASSFYWRSTDQYKGPWTITGPATGGFEALNTLKKVQLESAARIIQKNGKSVIQIKLNNKDKVNGLAFFVQLQLEYKDGHPIKGAFYSDNFVNLLPGESKEIEIEPGINMPANWKKDVVIHISGYNVEDNNIVL